MSDFDRLIEDIRKTKTIESLDAELDELKAKPLASEALFMFMAWLTGRDTPVTFSARHEAGIAAELVSKFCKANNLEMPRDRWTDRLVHPSEE